MRGRDLIMGPEGQWEDSKKIAWEGERQKDIYIYKLTSRLQERIGLRADSLKTLIPEVPASKQESQEF